MRITDCVSNRVPRRTPPPTRTIFRILCHSRSVGSWQTKFVLNTKWYYCRELATAVGSEGAVEKKINRKLKQNRCRTSVSFDPKFWTTLQFVCVCVCMCVWPEIFSRFGLLNSARRYVYIVYLHGTATRISYSELTPKNYNCKTTCNIILKFARKTTNCRFACVIHCDSV